MTSDLAHILKAAGEPTRLRLLNLLRIGDTCVCDLQAVLGLPQHAVSRHLAVLRHAGLVADHRHGQRVLYSLARSGSTELLALRRLLELCCPENEVFRNDLKCLQQSAACQRPAGAAS